jgi:hypothetical protein
LSSVIGRSVMRLPVELMTANMSEYLVPVNADMADSSGR